MKKLFALSLVVALAIPSLFATAYMNANDVEPQKVTSTVTLEDDVKLIGKDGKHMTVEAMSDPAEAPDGEIFNNRIKLEGSGNATQRAISFPALEGETLIVYSHSSGDAERQLALTDEAGNQVAVIPAPEKKADIGIFEMVIPADGTYTMYSLGSGINVYCLICE